MPDDASAYIMDFIRHRTQFWVDACKLQDSGLLGAIDAEDFLERHPELVGNLHPSPAADWTDEDRRRHAELERLGVLPRDLFPNGKLYAALKAEGLMP